MTRLPRSSPGPVRHASGLRVLGCVAAVALLSACAGHTPRLSARQEAAQYAARAHGNYTPPGPPEDPWGPYIVQASARFDVPQQWIRAVMQVESGGHEYLNGQLITSPAGAMGLMQVMPETYEELQAQYHLGDDPYDPRDNILAGTAYLREMYDIYGSPGFLAAYNAGPHRLDDYLSNERPLPNETRRYVAMIAPEIEGVYPKRVSPAEAYAMNRLPFDIPPGRRYAHVRFASNRTPPPRPYHSVLRIAQLPEPPRPPAPARTQIARVEPPPHRLPVPPPYRRRGFQLISAAVAEPVPMRHGGSLIGAWAIQVGAFTAEHQARAAVNHAKAAAHAVLGSSHPLVASVEHGHERLWRARLTGLSREAAVRACEQLSRKRSACMVLSPDAQS